MNFIASFKYDRNTCMCNENEIYSIHIERESEENKILSIKSKNLSLDAIFNDLLHEMTIHVGILRCTHFNKLGEDVLNRQTVRHIRTEAFNAQMNVQSRTTNDEFTRHSLSIIYVCTHKRPHVFQHKNRER